MPIMQTEILKSFSSFGCDAQLAMITFEPNSKQEIYQVSVRYCTTPMDWNSNFQVNNFKNITDANKVFAEYVKDFI